MRIALIGAGVLGRRHLSALSTLGRPVALFVVDPSDAALGAAHDVFANSGFSAGSEFEARRAGVGDISDLSTIDVAIVATNARERREVLDQALACGVRRFLLEKVLFTCLPDYDLAGAAIVASDARAFVNCVRRTYGSFSQLQTLVAGRSFSYRVDGQGWGLACNVVHHLDEFAALAGTTNISVDASGLEPGYIPSKRAGYVELIGRIRARAADGSTFEAVCRDGPPGDRTVTITTPEASAVVSQQAATLTIRSGKERHTSPIDIPLQSRITAEHVRALLAGRAPALPDYETAAAVHRPMIAAFLEHLRRTRPDETFDECPIT